MDSVEEKLLSSIQANLDKDEMKKLMQCQSVEEVTSMLTDAGVELPDEVLDGVAGGGMWIWEQPFWGKIAEQLEKILG